MTLDRYHRFSIFIILFAGLGGILYGYDIGIIAGALIFIKQEIVLTHAQISTLVAAVLGGGSIAILIAGPLADRFGRRRIISVSAIIFIVGILLLVSSHHFIGILIGRLIEGIGVGIITVIIPLYLAESAPSSIRGMGVTAFQLFLTGGILCAYLFSLIFAPTHSWRAMFLCSLVPATLLGIGSLLIIESPRWLFFKGKKEQALQALSNSRSAQETEHDVFLMTQLEIKNNKKQQKEHLFQRHILFPFAIALAVAVLTQLTGINVFLQLSTLILQHSGLHSNVQSMLGSVSVGLVNFVITAVAMLCIDRIGRKPLLLIGTGGLTLSLIYLGAIQYFLSPGTLQGYLTISGFIFFILFFAIGPGVVVWLAISELMPMSIRGKGIAICLFANSLASTLFAMIFLSLVKQIGYAGVFWMCGGFTFLYLLLAVFFIPETKDKSLEEIEQYFYEQQRI
ncbi:MAG: sugar porter family MFS transporter [Gammaproteobacteria bacterium]|nr:sugar porter family MFS transporter [Gammaproteobacteria bacterium]